MQFLQKKDLDLQLREKLRLDVANGDADLLAELEDAAELAALGFYRDILRTRFDIDTEFAETGADRNASLVYHVAATTIFLFLSSIDPEKASAVNEKRHNAGLAWAQKAAEAKMSPGLAPRTDADGVVAQPSRVRYGGTRTVRENYLDA